MSILDNELVRKYFGEHNSRSQERRSNWAMAYRIIKSMQEPLRRGDKYLSISISQVTVQEIDRDWVTDFHPFYLRLPDRFQERECYVSVEQLCPQCRQRHVFVPDHSQKPIGDQPPTDEVEDAAMTLAKAVNHPTMSDEDYAGKLRELVRMARSTRA